MNQENRNTLRKKILQERDHLSQRVRTEKSTAIVSRIMELPEITLARVVFIYMHFRSEVETREMISRMYAAHQTIAIPYTLHETSQLAAVEITDPEKQLASGYCGIPEPLPELLEKYSCDPKTIDVAIVPGSVFDPRGGRLGYGGGYYDRFLKNAAPDAVRIGIAFELQVVDRVPVAAHDQFMDYLVTETNLYDCRRNRHAENSCLSR